MDEIIIIINQLNNNNNNNNNNDNDNEFDKLIITINELLNLSKDLKFRKELSKNSDNLNQLMLFIIKNSTIENERKYKFNLLSIRFLRNLCANVSDNQDIIVSNDIFINYLLNELIDNSIKDNQIEDTLNNRKKNISIAIQQLLINSIVLNENTQSLLWNQYKLYPNKLILLINKLKINGDEFKLLPINLMLIYNLILNSKDRLNELTSNTTSKENLEFIKLLLDLINDNDIDQEYEDQIFHWIHLIFKLILKNDKFKDIYESLSTAIELEEWVPSEIPDEIEPKLRKYYKDGKTNQYQIKLLNLLDSIINDQDQKNIKDYIEDSSIIDIKTCFFLLSELSQLYNIDFSRKNLTNANQSSTTALNQFDFDAIFFFIKIFANITTYSDAMVQLQLNKFKTNHKDINQESNDQKEILSRVSNDIDNNSSENYAELANKYDLNTLLRKRGLVGICIGSLHGNYDSGSSGGDNEKITSKGFNKNCESEDKGFKKEIIRILGNLAHKNYNNQNEIRELGGIELILNHCRFDVKNPFIKEWSVFAIRNLCEDNPENQNLINSLKVQGIANQDELKDLGIEVGVGENGTVNFKNSPIKK